MVKTLDKVALFRPICNRWIQRSLQDQLGPLERVLLMEIPQELEEANEPGKLNLLTPRNTRK